MSSPNSRDMTGIVTLFLILVIGLSLTPTVQDFVIGATGVANATYPGNLSGAPRALFVLVPLFWVILVIGVVLGGVILWLRSG